MLARWREKRRLKELGERLYLQALEASRDPVLYETHGVADTVDGRFEMLCLHAIILAHQVGQGEGGEDAARALNEAFVVAMDDTLREVGIGDLSVPRRVKKAAGALYDRHAIYAHALAAPAEGAEAAWIVAFQSLATQSGLTGIVPASLGRHVAAMGASRVFSTNP
jgi:cytochrome b pre-mRNA-processing protein 3